MATFKRFLVCADPHGELIHDESVSKLMGFAETWKPHYRICLGDLWDFAALRGGCSPEEKSLGIKKDFDAGLGFLDSFRPDFLTLGNHDDRIWQHAERCANGPIREHCETLVELSEKEFKKRKIKWVAYEVGKYLRMPEGGPKLLHGFHSGVNPAKIHFERYGPCLVGHVHSPSYYPGRHIDGGEAHALGCIGDIEKMAYANRYTAKLGWRQGFAYGIVNTKTGDAKTWQVTKEGETWISPQGVL